MVKVFLQEGWYDKEDFINATIAQKTLNDVTEKLSKLFDKSKIESKRDDERFGNRMFIFSEDLPLLELDGYIVHLNKNIYDIIDKELDGIIESNQKDTYIKQIISNYIDIKDFMLFKTSLRDVEYHFKSRTT